MSDNPLETSPEREAEIERRAKALWVADGSPEGRMAEYRERADELVRMEMAGKTGQRPVEDDFVEEAAIQQNLGEFPGPSGTADQGEKAEVPMTRDELRHQGDA